MTSRQPGNAPPGTTGTPDNDPMPGPGPRAASGPWPLVVPLALLIILGMAGLRGTVTQPHWNGPLRHDGLAAGLALEAVLGVLLVITVRRRSASLAQTVNEVAAKLRSVLIFMLGAGMIAVAAVIIIGLQLHLFTQAARPAVPDHLPTRKALPQAPQHPSTFHGPGALLLNALLIVVLLAAVALSIWWARRFRLPGGVPRKDGGLIAEDPEDLRNAVESGRSALRALDDARAAIIACYVAMETSLAERGTARAVADTPDELLARATQSGLVRGSAAARLTALFYEARFSSHPLGRGQRDAAERALDELAAALTEPAGAQPSGAGA